MTSCCSCSKDDMLAAHVWNLAKMTILITAFRYHADIGACGVLEHHPQLGPDAAGVTICALMS